MLNFGTSLQRPLKKDDTSPVTSSLGVENIKTKNGIIAFAINQDAAIPKSFEGIGLSDNSVFVTHICVFGIHKDVSPSAMTRLIRAN
jgi:hypothetical protein